MYVEILRKWILNYKGGGGGGGMRGGAEWLWSASILYYISALVCCTCEKGKEHFLQGVVDGGGAAFAQHIIGVNLLLTLHVNREYFQIFASIEVGVL